MVSPSADCNCGTYLGRICPAHTIDPTRPRTTTHAHLLGDPKVHAECLLATLKQAGGARGIDGQPDWEPYSHEGRELARFLAKERSQGRFVVRIVAGLLEELKQRDRDFERMRQEYESRLEALRMDSLELDEMRRRAR